MKLHEYIRAYYPQYYSIEHYPVADTIRIYAVKDEWGIFSNFYRTPIQYDGVTFDCTERLFHYLKFRPEATEGKAELLSFSAGQGMKMRMKHLYKVHPEWMRDDWGQIFVDEMKRCLRLKYEQSPEFRKALELSQGKFIVEDQTPFPQKEANTWGVKRIGDEYVGPNLLGRLLMELRDEKYCPTQN